MTPSDEVLRAYQAGGMSSAEVARVEELLVSNPAARRRLAQLGGVDLDEAPSRVRDRLFDDAEATSAEEGAPARYSVWRLAASIAFMAALALFGYRVFETSNDVRSTIGTTPIAKAEFDVIIHGTAEDRDRSELAQAYPSTLVRIEVEDVRSELGPFRVGLYRASGGELLRVNEGVDVDCYQGACVLSGLARDLAGSSEEGEHTLWILVSAEDFPTSLVVSEESGGRRLIRQELKLIADR